MLRILAVAVLSVLLSPTFAAAVVVLFEDFEDSVVGYTTSIPEFTDNGSDYFIRTNGSNIAGEVFSNIQGTSYFAAQDIDGEGATLPVTLTWSNLNIAGLTNLQFSAFFAEDDQGSNQDWDAPDFVHVDYQVDGNGFQELFWIENDGSATNSAPFVDTDFDGTGDGDEITNAFTEFLLSIPDIGTALDVRFTFNLDAGDEDIAFDNVTITGVPEPTAFAFGGLVCSIVGLSFGGTKLRKFLARRKSELPWGT